MGTLYNGDTVKGKVMNTVQCKVMGTLYKVRLWGHCTR